MADVLSQLLELAGPLGSVISSISDLRDAAESFRENPDNVSRLLERWGQIVGALRDIEADMKRDLTHDQVDGFRGVLTQILCAAKEALAAVAEERERVDGLVYRALATPSTNALLEKLAQEATLCEQSVLTLRSMLTTVSVIRTSVGSAATAAAAAADKVGPHRGATDPAPIAEPRFQRCFHVQANDRPMAFDFASAHADGRPVTYEAQLKALVLRNAATKEASLGTFALGIGGVGKTSALRALAQEQEVRLRFTDGIYMYSLGSDATEKKIVTMLSDFVQLSGDSVLAARILKQEVESAISSACSRFNGRSCLFIIDDIWTSNDISPAIVRLLSSLVSCNSGLDGNCSIVYSTRDKRLVDTTEGNYVEFKKRDAFGAEARNMLLMAASQTDKRIVDDLRFKPHIESILRVCNGLPFTLNIAGRLVSKMKEGWAPSSSHIAWEQCARTIEDINELLNNTDESFFVSLRASIKFLDSNRRKGFPTYMDAIESFCILKRQEWVPLTLCQHMWGTNSLDQAMKMRDNMCALGLIEWENHIIGSKQVLGLKFHDHTHAHAVWLANKSGGMGKWYDKVVRALSESVDRSRQGVCWPALLEDDGYVIQNVIRFLLGSGQLETVELTLQSAQWVAKVMATGNVIEYEQDIAAFERAYSALAPRNLWEAIFTWIFRRRDISILPELLKIVQMSQPACIGHIHAAWFQLYARLKAAKPVKGWMRRLMQEAITFATRPFYQSMVPCLVYPDVSLSYVHSVCFKVNGIERLDSEYYLAYGYENYLSSVEIFVSKVKKGFPPSALDIDTDGLNKDGDEITSMCFHAPASLITAHEIGIIRVWNIHTGKQVKQIETGHTDTLRCVAVGRSGKIFVSGSEDRTVQIWDASTGAQLNAALVGHTDGVTCVAVSADGSCIVSGSDDNTVRIWRLDSASSPSSVILTGHTKWVNCVSLSADGRRVVSGSFDNTVRVWDVASGEQVCERIADHTGYIESVDISADGRRVASGSGDESVRVWDVSTGAQIGPPLIGHTNWVACVRLSADGRCVVSGASDETVREWELDDDGAQGAVAPTGHTECVQAVVMSVDEKVVVSGSMDNTLRRWDVLRGSQIGGPLVGHSDDVTCVAISGDSRLIVSGSDDHTVRLWDAARGVQIGAPMEGHTKWVSCVAISADCSRIASGAFDMTVRVWDTRTGTEVCPPLADHSEFVDSVAISPDGKRVVSTDDDHTLRLWSVASGTCEQTISQGSSAHTILESDVARRYIDGVSPEPSAAARRTSSFSDVLHYRGEGPETTTVAVFDSFIKQAIFSRDEKVVALGLVDGSVGILKVLK